MEHHNIFQRIFLLTGFVLMVALPVFGQIPRGIEKIPTPLGHHSIQRIALVIGNSDYSVGRLKNPKNDAQDMAVVLQNLGFEVALGINQTRTQMKEIIENFGAQLNKKSVGLFYYAGHGVQVNGSNYLIPLGANIQKAGDIQGKAIEVDLVLKKMEQAKNALNFIILDACRDNPFSGNYRSYPISGLAEMNAPTGTLIAYATSPGSIAADGKGHNAPYTGKLLKHIQTPLLTVEEMFKRVRKDVLEATNHQQKPWESTSLIGSFYFVPTENAPHRQLLDQVTHAIRLHADDNPRAGHLVGKYVETYGLGSLHANLDMSADNQYKLGKIYRKGYGIEPNAQQALFWYEQAALQNPKAMTATGYMYFKGVGVAKDVKKAVELYERAVEKGEADAMYNLGLLYYTGRGLDKNKKRGLEYFKRAAQKGHRYAIKAVEKLD